MSRSCCWRCWSPQVRGNDAWSSPRSSPESVLTFPRVATLPSRVFDGLTARYTNLTRDAFHVRAKGGAVELLWTAANLRCALGLAPLLNEARLATVEKVDDEADEHPHQEAQPRQGLERDDEHR